MPRRMLVLIAVVMAYDSRLTVAQGSKPVYEVTRQSHEPEP
jgi:hypothetical protein